MIDAQKKAKVISLRQRQLYDQIIASLGRE